MQTDDHDGAVAIRVMVYPSKVKKACADKNVDGPTTIARSFTMTVHVVCGHRIASLPFGRRRAKGEVWTCGD
ncbi:hypothetical protein SAMN05192539_1006217 [Paraburkholderia diazotrophica]|uniref:Uncharacterized protein n=1 Tax=Paraburkholderia diazotrophica TaxID=667676 RepID=A0A1H6W336_9BURK|nr:hypothetical protein SAMN05192539_1006217 [Paraburkholderia diazotrophica]